MHFSSSFSRPLTASSMLLLWELFVPTFLVHLTRGLLLTTLPLYVLTDMQLSKTHVGIAVGAIGLGKVVTDIPAGYLLDRIGARKLMLVCGLVVSSSAVLMVVSGSSFALVVAAMFLCGAGEGIGVLSRLSMLTDSVPIDQRGRVSALLGGSARIAMAVGPLLSALLTRLGGTEAVFWSQSFLGFLSVVVVYWSSPTEGPAGSKSGDTVKMSYWTLAKSLFHVSIFILALQVVRETRKLIFPLAGVAIGLSPAQVSVFASISFTLDALLFPFAGKCMDTYGRVFAGVLSVSLMTLAQLLLVPAVTPMVLGLNAVISGVGNGVSSGIIVAFGADLAPKDQSKAKFLGSFRLCADAGELIGPLLVGLVAQFTSIPTMINVVVTCGVVGVYWLIFFTPETACRRSSASIELPPIELGKSRSVI